MIGSPTDDWVTLEALDDRKIGVTSYPLHEQPLCISHQSQSPTFTVACVKSNELSETSCIRLFNEFGFGILHTYQLDPSPLKEVVYGGSMLSCVFSGDEQEYVCVGTVTETFLARRILVFIVKQGRELELVTKTRPITEGFLYCITAFNGMLLAGIGQNLVIFNWMLQDNGTRALQQTFKLRLAPEEPVSCVQNLGNFIFTGSRITVSKAQMENNRVIETLARNSTERVSAVGILVGGIYIGATENLEQLTLCINQDANHGEDGLAIVGRYVLGDQVTRFCHGSLFSAGAVSTCLFSTISGGIGLIASLPEESYEFMNRLQDTLRKSIDPSRNIQPADLNILLDGDLITSFFDLDSGKKEEISRQLDLSVEEVERRIKAVSRFH